jgi:hypothetical protein
MLTAEEVLTLPLTAVPAGAAASMVVGVPPPPAVTVLVPVLATAVLAFVGEAYADEIQPPLGN